MATRFEVIQDLRHSVSPTLSMVSTRTSNEDGKAKSDAARLDGHFPRMVRECFGFSDFIRHASPDARERVPRTIADHSPFASPRVTCVGVESKVSIFYIDA